MMKVTLWGTRGSLASAGPDTVRYGGNTSCVEVRSDNGNMLILDAGTGIRRLGGAVTPEGGHVHILLSHLHMDHIQGLGFFAPLYGHDLHVHIWGAPSTTQNLRSRLTRYLSPPLFPVNLRELPHSLTLHDVTLGRFAIGGFEIETDLVCHPGPTVGYRITDGTGTLAYLPDHEPALGVRHFPDAPEWTSGFDLAAGADLLIHDTQFTTEEYEQRVGWGHSTLPHALAFAATTGVKRLVTFHHDPSHPDSLLDTLFEEATKRPLPFEIVPGMEGSTLEVR